MRIASGTDAGADMDPQRACSIHLNQKKRKSLCKSGVNARLAFFSKVGSGTGKFLFLGRAVKET